MDILKTLTKKSYFSSLMLGNFYAEPSFNAEHTFDFSCNVEYYYEKINGFFPVSRSQISHTTTIRNISNFIESCLILGEFLHEIRSTNICLIKSYCFTEFFILYQTPYRDNEGRMLKEPRSIIISLESHEDEKVLLRINSTRSDKDSITEIIFDGHKLFNPYCIPGFDFRYIPGSTECRIMNKYFNKPRYNRLPLYINTPFIRVYAKEQYMNPPIPEEYIRPFSKIFYI